MIMQWTPLVYINIQLNYNTTTTTTQQCIYVNMTYTPNNSTHNTSTFEKNSITCKIYIIYKYTINHKHYPHQNLINNIQLHRKHFRFRATCLGEYINSPWRTQKMGYSPRRARGELKASKTGCSRPFWHFSH